MNPEEIPPHEFLIGDDGLSTAAKELPNIREEINDLKQTTGTFKPKNVTDLHWNNFSEIHYEFLKAWPYPDRYGVSVKSYVNPNYIHAYRYSDVVAECECGATFTHNYDSDHHALEDEHAHRADCLSYYRLAARASMHRKRHESLNRLTWLGWKGLDIAKRWGVHRGAVGTLARKYSESITSLRERFKVAAAKTYVILVREHGVPAGEVCEVYDYSKTTLGRWANEFDIESANATFTRDEKGNFVWQTADS